eukprot:54423-Amphidinium_carterae.5
MLKKGMVAILDEHGGVIVQKSSDRGWRAVDVLSRAAAKEEQSVKLHAESGVRNFYIQNERHQLHKLNFDTGAAETVTPVSFFDCSGGPEQAAALYVPSKTPLELAPVASDETLVEWLMRRAGSPAEEGDEWRMRDEDEEFQEPRRVQDVETVSRSEREQHELLGHVECRSWCQHCVSARGVGQPRRSVPEDPLDTSVPEIVLDYYFLGEENETMPHSVLKDRGSDAYFSSCLDAQGSTYAVAYVTGALQWLGCKRVGFENLPLVECVPKEARIEDSRAQGAAENAVKQLSLNC